jgi:hypothetical protein
MYVPKSIATYTQNDEGKKTEHTRPYLKKSEKDATGKSYIQVYEVGLPIIEADMEFYEITPIKMIGNMKDKVTFSYNAIQSNMNLEGTMAKVFEEAEIKNVNDDNNQTSALPKDSVGIKNTGFQGYKGGFENRGKGTPEGDGKDKAMRQIADGFIGEIVKNNSSSQTSRNTIIDKSKVRDMSQSSPTSAVNIPLQGKSGAKIIMLARNSERSNNPLTEETKYWIRNANIEGAEFIVGDMPNVDSQFIDYLQEIGAKFTIYHTGTTPRISIKQTEPQRSVENKILDIIFAAGDDYFNSDQQLSLTKLSNNPELQAELEKHLPKGDFNVVLKAMDFVANPSIKKEIKKRQCK